MAHHSIFNRTICSITSIRVNLQLTKDSLSEEEQRFFGIEISARSDVEKKTFIVEVKASPDRNEYVRGVREEVETRQGILAESEALQAVSTLC